MAPSVPTCRKSRRVTPLQVTALPFPVNFSMVETCGWRLKDGGLPGTAGMARTGGQFGQLS